MEHETMLFDRRRTTPSAARSLVGLIAPWPTPRGWTQSQPAPLCAAFWLVPPPPRSLCKTPPSSNNACVQSPKRGPATEPPPDIGPRLCLITSTEVALRFNDTPYRVRIPAGRPWPLLLGQGTSAALVLSLDPLSRSAAPAEIDAHLDRATVHQRLLFGHTRAE
ncbi:hypothetical protein ACFW92_21735 [Streptomyces scopuliridis]